ncbi:MAG: hypothetical protein DMD80_23720 [Candidatus Rokuibacteriota bacterium]|nr:MAG: hypothetical protein DMD80_23720 [Candidatus Rokubacteria bacterium]
MKWVVILLLGLLLLGQSSAAAAGSDPNESTPEQVAYGAGSVLGTVVYAPFKAAFCILGAIGSAFTAIVSPPTAGKIVGASCRGTWSITPDVLKGKEKFQFVGEVRPGEPAAKKK